MTTRRGSPCSRSTPRTPSAPRTSSCSCRAHPTTTAGSASSSTGISARSRRSSRHSTRTRRCRSSTLPGSWTRTACTRRRTASSPRPTSSAASGRRRTPTSRRTSCEYVGALEARGRFQLTIWPYHAMVGGIGHALVSAVEEAFFFHGIARDCSPAFQFKGDDPRTEHYSALGPEVGGRRNEELIELLGWLRPDPDCGPGQEPLRRLDGRGSARGRRRPSTSTCWRTARRRSSCPAQSTTPRRRTLPSSGSRPPVSTSCARPSRSRRGLA